MPLRTTIETRPSGASEGRMALICPALTNSGIASTLVSPWLTVIWTPPRLVPSGNSVAESEASGPMRLPKIVKIEPRASEPFGSPGRAKLAALTTARGGMRAC
ncbi:MAG: hypothetical protein R2724_16150 [Bryobacterales bacterium]